MIELNVSLGLTPQTTALDTALRAAAPGKVVGLSTYGPARPISIWLDDSASSADQTAATGVAQSHDPMFIALDKTTIFANSTDTATVSVTAAKQGAAPVILLVGGNQVPVTMSGGAGSVTITATSPKSISISVQSGANRSADVLTLQAI